MTWVNAVLQGVFLGGLYALLACGLSLLFGVMRIINLAHGDLAVLGGLQLMLGRPGIGREMRATAQDADTAGLVGVPSSSVYARATAIAVATATLAGAFLAMRTTFSASSGPTQLIFAFEAV